MRRLFFFLSTLMSVSSFAGNIDIEVSVISELKSLASQLISIGDKRIELTTSEDAFELTLKGQDSVSYNECYIHFHQNLNYNVALIINMPNRCSIENGDGRHNSCVWKIGAGTFDPDFITENSDSRIEITHPRSQHELIPTWLEPREVASLVLNKRRIVANAKFTKAPIKSMALVKMDTFPSDEIECVFSY
jgi:hypothetical protein